MENQKNNKGLVVLLVIFIILTLVLGGFILYDKVLSNENPDVNNNSNSVTDNNTTETTIDNVEIKNSEVKELYNYVQASLNSNYVCLGYFYQNPFKNHTLEDKISLVLINYASNYKKKIDDNFLQKIPQNERDLVKNSSEYYIDVNDVKNGMKLIFNIDVQKFDDNANYAWDYRSDVNAFVEIIGGGGYEAEPIQQIIEYNELNDEINLTVVKAEILSSSETNIGANGETIKPAGAYRYVNNSNTLVLENITDDFKFTKENVSKFPQLKYIFKKNDNGKYYVSDIVNLNFEEDFESCN